MILLIGSVGSGKSTFIRYIKNVILPEDDKISENLQWFILDMNKAPLAEDKIYDWIISYVIEELVRFNSLNLNLDFLKCLFEDEVKEFENGIGKLLQGNNSYNVKLYELLESLLHNDQRKLKSLIKYIRKKEKKTCIIIFDNVDKATDESQLLMFQVAEWFRKEFKTLIIMPLRDTTYSKYRNKPPLDTVIKDMVYRIDPPDLLKVLQERLNYIIRLITNDYRQENYALKNGIKVKLNDDERLEYIKAILYSIRGNDLVKHLFYTIADKNIRSGIELFIDFCRSGYLKSDDFFKVRATNGEYIIPNHMMVNAVIRGNRKYYNSGQSKIKKFVFIRL